MNYEFNSMLFDTPYRRDRAIAESWLYADGLNDETEVRRTLATVSPEQLASEAMEFWGFDLTDEDAPTLESMIDAFRSFATKAPDMRVEFSSNSLGRWLHVFVRIQTGIVRQNRRNRQRHMANLDKRRGTSRISDLNECRNP